MQVRKTDIPMLDPYREEMLDKNFNTFSFGGHLNFEAYVQYEEYGGFTKAMDTLRSMKLMLKGEDGKAVACNIKVGEYPGCVTLLRTKIRIIYFQQTMRQYIHFLKNKKHVVQNLCMRVCSVSMLQLIRLQQLGCVVQRRTAALRPFSGMRVETVLGLLIHRLKLVQF